MKYPEPKFTADQLAAVFCERWKGREIMDAGIHNIRTRAILDHMPTAHGLPYIKQVKLWGAR